MTLLSPRSLKDRTTQAGSISPEATHIFLVRWRLPGCPINWMPLGTEIFTYTCRGRDAARGARNMGALPACPTGHHVSPRQRPCSSGKAPFPFPIRTSYSPLSCWEPPLYFSPPTSPWRQLPLRTKVHSRAACPAASTPGTRGEGPLHLLLRKALLLTLCPTSEVRGVIIEFCVCAHGCRACVCIPTCVCVSVAYAYPRARIYTRTVPECTHAHVSVSMCMCGYTSQSRTGSLVHIHLSNQHI